jgi:hypothetical protein
MRSGSTRRRNNRPRRIAQKPRSRPRTTNGGVPSETVVVLPYVIKTSTDEVLTLNANGKYPKLIDTFRRADPKDTDVDQPNREHVLTGPAQRVVYHTHTKELEAPVMAGDTVALLRAAVQASKGFAGIAQVISTIEAEHTEQQSAPTKKAA